MAVTLGKHGHQNVGAGDDIVRRAFDVEDRALDDTLEGSRRMHLVSSCDDQLIAFGVEIIGKVAAQFPDADPAGRQYLGDARIFREREQEVFERCIFMVPLHRQLQ